MRDKGKKYLDNFLMPLSTVFWVLFCLSTFKSMRSPVSSVGLFATGSQGL